MAMLYFSSTANEESSLLIFCNKLRLIDFAFFCGYNLSASFGVVSIASSHNFNTIFTALCKIAILFYRHVYVPRLLNSFFSLTL